MRILLSWFLVISVGLTTLLFSTANHTILHVTEFEEIQRLGIGTVNDFAFHPDNQILAVGTDTGLYLYSVPELRQVSNFDFFHDAINDLVWSPDGKWLAYTTDTHVYMWNYDTHEVHQLIDEIRNTRLDWSPDGTQLAAIGIPKKRFSTGNNLPWSKLYRWKVQDNQIQHVSPVTVHASQVGFYQFYWTEDYMIAYNGRYDEQLVAWQVDNPQHIISLGGYVSAQHQTISRDKHYIVLSYYGENDYQIHRLDTRTLQWDDVPISVLVNFYMSVWGEKELIWRDPAGLTIINTENWTVEQTVELSYAIDTHNFILSNDEQYVAATSNEQLILIETSTWQIVQSAPILLPTNYYTFSSDYKYFAITQRTPQQAVVIQVIDPLLQSGPINIVDFPEGVRGMAFSPDNHYLAIIHNDPKGYDNTRLTIVDLETQKMLPMSWSLAKDASDIAWRQHDILVVLDGQIYQIPIEANGLPSPDLTHLELLNATKFIINIYYGMFVYGDFLFFYSEDDLHFYQNDKLKWQSDIYQPPSNPVSYDGKYLLTVKHKSSKAYFLQIREIRTGKILDEKLFTFLFGDVGPRVTAVAWHADYLAVALNYNNGLNNSIIQFWSIDNKGHFYREEPMFELNAHTSDRRGCCGGSSYIMYLWWLGDDLYSIGNDGTIRTWGIPD